MLGTNKAGMALIVALLVTASGVLPSAHATTAPGLGKAGNYVVLAEAIIKTTGTTSITGNIGLSPDNSSYLVGFSQTLDSSGSFATSHLVNGKIYASNYGNATQATLLTAVSEMRNAFSAAEAVPTTVSEGTTPLNGQTLPPGVYTWKGNTAMTGSISLSGNSSSVWILQIPGTFDVSNGVSVNLGGGATPSNVFWQVLGITTIGTTVSFQGIILDASDIYMQTDSAITGRLYSEMGVSLESNSIVAPAVVTSTSTSSTVPEFPGAAVAVVVLVAMAAVGLLSKRGAAAPLSRAR